jgi:hypothetical protein
MTGWFGKAVVKVKSKENVPIQRCSVQGGEEI